MGIMTAQDLPIQDERLSPYNLPNQINPLRGAFTEWGVETLNNVGTYKSLANTATSFVHDKLDGWFSEHPEVSAPLSAEVLARVRQHYPELEIGKEASREQVEAAIDRREREKTLEYLEMHASPGFASDAALFAGGVAGSLTDVGALLGTKWITMGLTHGSELIASKVAESAVSRLGGTASVKAQQLIADNAGKLAFLKGGIGLAAFTGIEDIERQGSARLSNVLTPNEADYKLMDGVFNVASSGLVGGLLGVSAEKLTGKMIDKGFVLETPEQKAARRETQRTTKQQEREEMLNNIHIMGFADGSSSELFRKSAAVIKAFFQSSKESTERETLDNVSQAFESGKDPETTNDYIFEVNRHEAWKRLHQYMADAQIWPDEFIKTLEQQRPELLEAISKDNPSMDDLQQFMTNEALIDLATRTEDEVLPSDEAKASYIKSMRENKVHFDDDEGYQPEPMENKSPDDILQNRIDAFSDAELATLAENGNQHAKRAIKRKSLLELQQPFIDFVKQFGIQIAGEIEGGIELNADYLKRFFDFLSPDGLEAIERLTDANATDIDFMLENLSEIFESMRSKDKSGLSDLTPEKLQSILERQFKYIKAQVIRSQRDAVTMERKIQVLDNAVKSLDQKDGQAIRQGMNALLDRSLFQFEGANSGTYRKMNDAGQRFQISYTNELDDISATHFWNDTNSSTEITRALYSDDMGLPMNEFSESAKKVAKLANKYFDLAIEGYAKEGIIIPKMKGRIHHQWHNPYKILRMPLKDRIKLSFSERRNMQFDKWFQYIEPLIDLEKTFESDFVFENEPDFIDIKDPKQIRDFFRRTFDKIVDSDYRKEKSNLLTKRSKRRVLQFKSPEAFAQYTRKYGAGDAQSAILRELTGMFREIELIKDWGAEPEKMLDEVLKHAESLPGWKEYSQKKDAATPKRLMHLMRFGSAHATADSWQGMFSEVVYNTRAFESVTKLGNLFFLNMGDSLIAANALNRFSIPMQESIVNGLKETFSRYSPEQKKDFMRMFGIGKEQYFGGYYRHFEDGTLSDRLNKMIRLTMKITGTENSEYSNRSMIGQSLSAWIAKHVKTMKFDELDSVSKGTLLRYEIGADEWKTYKLAVRKYKGNDYIGWDTVLELSDNAIHSYLKSKGVERVTKERINIARDELSQKYRMLMLDQMDDALNRKSLIETDLLRFKRNPADPSVADDVIKMFMLFKTYGFMWIRRHVGDRIYGRGATGYRVSQIQGTADWHGLMKLMMLSFSMELAINQMKSLANDREPLPLDGKTAMDALTGSLGPISYLTRIDGSNLLSSITRMAAGPIGGDVEKIARIATQFERGFWKGDYTNAQVNSVKFLASQFGGVPMLKSAMNTLLFDNMIQNIKGHRTGHIIDKVASNQPEG